MMDCPSRKQAFFHSVTPNNLSSSSSSFLLLSISLWLPLSFVSSFLLCSLIHAFLSLKIDYDGPLAKFSGKLEVSDGSRILCRKFWVGLNQVKASVSVLAVFHSLAFIFKSQRSCQLQGLKRWLLMLTRLASRICQLGRVLPKTVSSVKANSFQLLEKMIRTCTPGRVCVPSAAVHLDISSQMVSREQLQGTQHSVFWG